MNASQVADAIIAAIAASGFDTDLVNVYSHPETDPELPALIVWPGVDPFISYQESFGPNGLIVTNWRIELRVSAGVSGEGDAYRTMYSMLGTGSAASVFDALEKDRSLNALVSNAVSLDVSTVRRVVDDRGLHLSADFPLVTRQRRGT